MPTYQVNERWDGRTGTASLDNPRSLKRTFEVLVDEQGLHANQIIDAVASAAGCRLGAPHPLYPPARCQTLNADTDDNPLMWVATAEYAESRQQQNGAGTDSGAPAGTGGDDGPEGQSPDGKLTYQPPKISFRPTETYLPHDVNGKPYANTAGVPVENPPPGFVVNGTLNVPRRYPINGSTDVAWFMAIVGKANLNDWGGFLAGELRVGGADFEPSGGWWEGNWTLEVKQDLWLPTRMMSVGRCYQNVILNVTNHLERKGFEYIREAKTSAPILEPIYLDDIGLPANIQLPVGTSHVEHYNLPVSPNVIDPGGPAVLEFRQMLPIDFAAFLGTYLY
ncbi:hypothetical protein [Zavarzinella formosa]|uniref:hypothetical protein n=1 Tax=Zavarzinella formosa TaxID=360055 RepID=UPI0002FD2C04|nr:hypothetical protein [Zavarzinella formosa]